jgi:hypothetical protein
MANKPRHVRLYRHAARAVARVHWHSCVAVSRAQCVPAHCHVSGISRLLQRYVSVTCAVPLTRTMTVVCPIGYACNGSRATRCAPPTYQNRTGMNGCAVSPSCSSSTQYEQHPPTYTSARVCTVTRPPCDAISQMEVSTATATTDRVCKCRPSHAGTSACQLCAVSMPHCSTCVNETQCTSCVSPHVLDANGTCVTCPIPHCVSCATADTCAVCEPGYNTTQCTCAIPHCNTCNGTQCAVCVPPTRVLSDGSCGWTGCTDVRADGRCRTCLHADAVVTTDGHCDQPVSRTATDTSTRAPELTAIWAVLAVVTLVAMLAMVTRCARRRRRTAASATHTYEVPANLATLPRGNVALNPTYDAGPLYDNVTA